MKIYLDRAIDFFIHNHEPCVEIEINKPTLLREILIQVGIPLGEVHLVILNGEAIEMSDILINNHDTVKLFPPFGGG